MQPTNPQQFTEKAWQAVVKTADIAKQNNHQQIESEHLLKALLEEEGLTTSILNKADISVSKVRDKVDRFINSQPKVKNLGDSIYLGRSLDGLLDRAEKFRKDFEDEYISIEPLL